MSTNTPTGDSPETLKDESSYTFVQLDPRPGKSNPDYSFAIEVTKPDLLKADVPHLDHHGEGTTIETPAACEQALEVKLPEDGTTLATLKVDKDSLTAMAVIASRNSKREINDELVQAVGEVDRYGPRAIDKQPEYRDLLIALDVVSGNHKMPLSERVRFAQKILDGTYDKKEVKNMVEERDRAFEEAVQASRVDVIIPEKLVFVESSHRFAMSIGYEKGSTVIAFNPEMPKLERVEGTLRPTGKTYKKFTIARYDEHVPTDIEAIAEELARLEAEKAGVTQDQLSNSWGGQASIIGSPQNESSRLSPDEVKSVVAKYIDTAS